MVYGLKIKTELGINLKSYLWQFKIKQSGDFS